MCNICEDLKTSIKIKSPGDLKSLLHQIDGLIARKSLKIIAGNYSYTDILNKECRPDFIQNIYKCTKCRTKFELCCETYHGSGGSWSAA